MLSSLILVLVTVLVLFKIGSAQNYCPDIRTCITTRSESNHVISKNVGEDVTMHCGRNSDYDYRWQFRLPIHNYTSVIINENWGNGTNILVVENYPNVTVNLTLSDDGNCFEGNSCANNISYQNFQLVVSNISTELNGALVSCGFHSNANHFYSNPFVLIITKQATTHPPPTSTTISSTTASNTTEATTPPTTSSTDTTSTVNSPTTENCTTITTTTNQVCKCNESFGSESMSAPTSTDSQSPDLSTNRSVNNATCISIPITVIAIIGTGLGVAVLLVSVFVFIRIYKCLQDKRKQKQLSAQPQEMENVNGHKEHVLTYHNHDT